MPIIQIDAAKKAEIDLRVALEAVDAWYAEQVSAGFQTEFGWKLGISESDVTLLTGAFVLAKEASSVGLPLPPIVDTSGVPHSLTMEQMTGVMLAYGQHRAAISGEYAARKAAASQGG